MDELAVPCDLAGDPFGLVDVALVDCQLNRLADGIFGAKGFGVKRFGVVEAFERQAFGGKAVWRDEARTLPQRPGKALPGLLVEFGGAVDCWCWCFRRTNRNMLSYPGTCRDI